MVEDLFEEIFRRELGRWQPDEKVWPDTADFDLFTRWFTVEGYSIVEDAGRGGIGEDPAGGPSRLVLVGRIGIAKGTRANEWARAVNS